MQILYNAIRCPDGTLLESFHAHDYKEHVDNTNGKTYIIDGGREYCRRSCNGDEEVILKYYSNGRNHEEDREWFYWGTYGITGRDKLKYIKLKSLSTGHILNILDNVDHVQDSYIEKLLIKELEYRNESEL